MRYAVLADIHSNLEALQAVLEDAEACGAEAIVSLGDIVGYYAQPNECIELLGKARALCISGNHDAAAAGVRRPLHFGHVARAAVGWTSSVLSPQNRASLAALPLTARLEGGVVLVHAGLHPVPNSDVRLSTPELLARTLARLVQEDARAVFVGHTHRRLLCRRDGCAVQVLSTEGEVSIAGGEFLVNPGSVGQPRDGTRQASYLLYDSTSLTCCWRSVRCDFVSCRAKAGRAGLLRRPPLCSSLAFWLSDRLDGALSLIRGGVSHG